MHSRRRLRSLAIRTGLLATLGLTLPAAALAAPAGIARLDAPTALPAGAKGVVTATVTGPWCRIVIDSYSAVRRAPSGRFTLTWTVPATARSGAHRLRMGCASTSRRAARMRLAATRIRVTGGKGRGGMIRGGVHLDTQGGVDAATRRKGLPKGMGDPDAVSVAAPVGTGGGPFTTALPFDQGTKVSISQGPGGSTSHYDIYNQDAVDFGVPTGTTIRAGFTGVVAHVSTGCPNKYSDCGDGYGNYVYLKAADGTCAEMAHLSVVNVVYGQQLTAYDVVGLSGTSGHAYGAHLHYNRVNCATNTSLPWTPSEGGSLTEGSVLTSNNHPPEVPCTAIQGGCTSPQPSTGNPQPASTTPIQGPTPPAGGTGGGTPQPSITASKGGPRNGGATLNIAVHAFPTGTFTYECHDNSGPNGTDTVFFSHSVQVTDADQSSWPGVFCYDSSPYTAYLVMNGVRSNDVGF